MTAPRALARLAALSVVPLWLAGCAAPPPGTVYSDSPGYPGPPAVEAPPAGGPFIVLPPPVWADPPFYGYDYYDYHDYRYRPPYRHPGVVRPGYPYRGDYGRPGRPPRGDRPGGAPPDAPRPSPRPSPPVVSPGVDTEDPIRRPTPPMTGPIDPGSPERAPAPRTPAQRQGGPGINNIGGS